MVEAVCRGRFEILRQTAPKVEKSFNRKEAWTVVSTTKAKPVFFEALRTRLELQEFCEKK